MFMKEIRKAVLAACVKYHDRISSEMYDWLVNDPNIVDVRRYLPLKFLPDPRFDIIYLFYIVKVIGGTNEH